MKKTFALLVVFAVMALPAVAARKPPPIDALLLAQAQALPQDQYFHMTVRTGFSLNAGAHTAQLTGNGSAQLDSGITKVPAGSPLNVTFLNTDDPNFAQCQEALGGDLQQRAVVDVAGKGHFNLSLLNGVIDQVTINLDSVTSCNVSQ